MSKEGLDGAGMRPRERRSLKRSVHCDQIKRGSTIPVGPGKAGGPSPFRNVRALRVSNRCRKARGRMLRTFKQNHMHRIAALQERTRTGMRQREVRISRRPVSKSCPPCRNRSHVHRCCVHGIATSSVQTSSRTSLHILTSRQERSANAFRFSQRRWRSRLMPYLALFGVYAVWAARSTSSARPEPSLGDAAPCLVPSECDEK